DGRHDLENARGDRPDRDIEEECQCGERGSQESQHADTDSEQPFEKQHPPMLVLPAALESRPGVEDSIREGVGAKEQHERSERDARLDPAHDSECDRNQAAQKQQPPATREDRCQMPLDRLHELLLLTSWLLCLVRGYSSVLQTRQGKKLHLRLASWCDAPSALRDANRVAAMMEC